MVRRLRCYKTKIVLPTSGSTAAARGRKKVGERVW